jgi:hypothetical protein
MAEDYLDKLFNADPMQDAADVADDQDLVTPLGKALAYRNIHEIADERRRVLIERDDTVRNDELPRYLRIAERLGFGLVYEEVFPDKHDATTRWYGVMFHDEHGSVLEIDTWGRDSVNSARLTYNWAPRIGPDGDFVKGYWEATGSGHFDSPTPLSSPDFDDARETWVWVGNSEVTEGLARAVDKLTTFGTFVSPWKYDARLELTHSGDFYDVHPGLPTPEDSAQYQAICTEKAAARAALLPADVLDRVILRAPRD